MTAPASHFELTRPRTEPRAVALVLHGGRATSIEPVRARNLAVVRMAPFATSLRHAGAEHGLAVARVRYAVRGWNGAQRSPVADVLAALDRIASELPGAPVAVVGHSMGGRTAVYTAAHPAVSAVVGLAPWIEPGDPVAPLRDRDVLVVHGVRDRTTSPRASEALIEAAQPLARSAAYVRMAGDGHPMLRRAALWHDLATGFVLANLCGVPPGGTVRAEAANVLEKVLAGTTEIDV
ncbi:MAG: alpha/beta hydrolase [Jatrophihabitans sp.]|uniref:alpha/beta hydrolase n=1 Tax=Jatrophihabitans sp. TaxID=1932789 RepID=UPI003F80C4F5